MDYHKREKTLFEKGYYVDRMGNLYNPNGKRIIGSINSQGRRTTGVRDSRKCVTTISCIGKSHRITKITTAQFYENNLHNWGDTPLTREKVIDVVKNVTGKDYSDLEYNFPLNEMVAWENESGCRTVAYTQIDSGFLPYLLNYRGRKDEQDRVWVFEDASNLDDRKAVKPTYNDICRYAIAMHKHAALYEKLYYELLEKHSNE